MILECGCDVSTMKALMIDPCADHRPIPLRDYFAGHALAGSIHEFFTSRDDVWRDYDDFATSLYNMADAMVRARQK